MAEIRPFRALRYDTSRVRLADVLTQPYDKVSPSLQDDYYRRSPYNLIRFELAKPEPGAAPESLYAQSAAFLAELRHDGVVRLDETLSLYAYLQRYRHPLESTRAMERLGLIALGRLYDYENGMVFRHEQTLSAPKADRMNLLRATRTHSGQIFMIYEDPTCSIERQLATAIATPPVDAVVTDDYGVENSLWRISDPALIEKLVAAFADKKLIIADGHHRYETARAYRDEQRGKGASGAQARNFVMMTLINLESPGLIVLPTHRVVHGIAALDWPVIRARLAEFFRLEPINGGPETLLQTLQQERGSAAFIMATPNGAWVLRGMPEALACALPSLSSAELNLDVTVLHEIILERIFALSEEDIREQRHVRYFREPEQALAELGRDGAAVFLLNPLPLPVLRDVCYAGKILPQKSTDFYPKLLSGLVMYNLDHSW